jgi:hypothetical protein
VLLFLVILLVVAVLFGLGTALEVALWALVVAAAIAVALVLLARAALRRF